MQMFVTILIKTARKSAYKTGLIATLCLLCATAMNMAQAQLPPAIEADRQLLAAKQAVDEGDHRLAVEKYEQILALDVAIPEEFWFFYAESLIPVERYIDAREALLAYLAETGQGGENYATVLERLNQIAGKAKEEKRATEYRQACDGGDMEGCRDLGKMYEYGKGLAEDKAKAVALYRQACDGGYMKGCVSLGGMYYLGHGVPEDKAKAAALYKKACDGDDMGGCNSLGNMYYHGEGVAEDKTKAKAFRRKACGGGFTWAC